MKVLIIGTGYVGLTTAIALAYLGNDVTCLDINSEKINKLKGGNAPFYEPHLDDMLQLALPRLSFTDSYDQAGIPESDIIFITVGTPSLEDGSANLEYVRQAAESIATRLGERFVVVVNKSTVPIGAGNWVDAVIRETFQKQNGHQPNGNYNVISSPEFLKQGMALHDTLYPDRIIIGSEHPASIARLSELFQPLLRQDFPEPPGLPRPADLREVPLVVCDVTSAEVIKYAANSFLALKISYINEIARLSQKVGADINQIARGIGLDKRIGPRFLEAGIGWGGSCFGKDTAALVATAREYKLEMPIIQAAREINYGQRAWVVDALQEALKILKGRRVALLGFSFKPDTDDLRDAPAVDIARMLLQRGALVRAHDPVALGNARRQYGDLGVTFCDAVQECLADAEAIVLVTAWPIYRELDWEHVPPVPLVDGRNFLERERLQSLGFQVIGVGR